MLIVLDGHLLLVAMKCIHKSTHLLKKIAYTCKCLSLERTMEGVFEVEKFCKRKVII